MCQHAPLLQALRWQRKRPHEGDPPPGSDAQQHDNSSSSPQEAAPGNTASNSSSARPQLVLELQDPSEQPAALAVLSALYFVKPLHELLSELPQEQQLTTAVLADQWDVPRVSSAAAKLLAAAVDTPGGLSEAVQQQVMGATALPDCLQPLVKTILLSLCGDLEAVWADAGLQERLLGLSLYAMELLLSSNRLKVGCGVRVSPARPQSPLVPASTMHV